MDGQELVGRVREDEATALSRLGSDKYLIAATGADLGTGPVLRSVAAWTATGRDAFERWADEEDGDAAAAFADAAERERDHYERVADALPDGDGGDDDGGGATDDGEGATDDPIADAVGAALAASEGTGERVAAGLVGRALVADRVLLQVVNFFVNEADDRRADLARDLRSDADAQLETGIELLDSVCESDDDWAAARRAAAQVVADAYGAYANALEAMGVDPKPVC